MENNKYDFSSLPNKLLGFPDSYIHEMYCGKDFSSVNVGDIIEYTGNPTWNRWQEIEIERRQLELNCQCIMWYEGNKAMMKFINKDKE